MHLNEFATPNKYTHTPPLLEQLPHLWPGRSADNLALSVPHNRMPPRIERRKRFDAL
jgi:hypothetical protein